MNSGLGGSSHIGMARILEHSGDRYNDDHYRSGEDSVSTKL